MRLIDADALNGCKIIQPYKGEMVDRAFVRILEVDDIPTAYDPNKVVEQLEDRSTLSRPVGWSKSYEIVTLEDAIEIVRGGEIS